MNGGHPQSSLSQASKVLQKKKKVFQYIYMPRIDIDKCSR